MKTFKVLLTATLALSGALASGVPLASGVTLTSAFSSQDVLLAFAGPLQDEALENAYFSKFTGKDSGFAGVAINPENLRIDLYWRGNLSDKAISLVDNLPKSVKLKVHSTEYSLVDEASAIRDLEASPGYGVISTAGTLVPSDTGSGVRLESYFGSFSKGVVDATEFVDAESELPLEAIDFPRGGLLASRLADTTLFAGGSLIFTPTDGACSSGFNVTSSGSGVDYVLTAQHCFHKYYASGSTDVDVYNGYTNGQARRVGIWKNLSGYNYLEYDAGLYRPSTSSTESSIYVGPPQGSTKISISSVFNPVKGQTVCTDGARSGEHCNIVVDNIFYSWSADYGDGTIGHFKNLVAGHAKSYGVAVVTGDSGGPVYDYQNGGYAAVGIITGGLGPSFECGIAGELCFNGVVFSSVYRDLNALGMELKK